MRYYVNIPVLVIFFLQCSNSSAVERKVCHFGCTYNSISSALTNSVSGDVVVVAQGIYRENIVNDGIIIKSLQGREVTIIEALMPGPTVLMKGASQLDGFTIRGGSSDLGAGISIENNADAEIRNCKVTENKSQNAGGGIWSDGIVKVLNSVISHNISSNDGGGIAYTLRADISIENSIIAYNQAKRGGAIYFAGRTSGHNNLYALSTFKNNVISYNRAATGGGAYLSTNSMARLHNNLFIYNEAENGSGVFTEYDSRIQFINNTVTRNISASGVAGFYLSPDSAESRDSRTVNNIIWGNVGLDINEQLSPPVVANSNVGNGFYYSATYQQANTGVDPIFNDPANSDFSLHSRSPMIDAGLPTVLNDGITRDIEMKHRYLDDKFILGPYDIGAYEYAPETQVTLILPESLSRINCLPQSVFPLEIAVDNWAAIKDDRRFSVVLKSVTGLGQQYSGVNNLCELPLDQYFVVVRLFENNRLVSSKYTSKIDIIKPVPKVSIKKFESDTLWTETLLGDEPLSLNIDIQNWPIDLEKYFISWSLTNTDNGSLLQGASSKNKMDIAGKKLVAGNYQLTLLLDSNTVACGVTAPAQNCEFKYTFVVNKILATISSIQPQSNNIYRLGQFQPIFLFDPNDELRDVSHQYTINWSVTSVQNKQVDDLHGSVKVSDLHRGVGKINMNTLKLNEGHYLLKYDLINSVLNTPVSSELIPFSLAR